MTERPELPKIQSVRARSNFRLEIQWKHGETSMIGLRGGLIERGGVFDALRDADLFATVQIGDRGRYIEWRDPTNPNNALVDIDADSLIRQADGQQAKLSLTRLLKTIRNQLAHETNP